MAEYTYLVGSKNFTKKGFNRSKFVRVANARLLSGQVTGMSYDAAGTSVVITTSADLDARDKTILDRMASIHATEREDSAAGATVTVALLPADGLDGETAYVSDGLKTGESGGSGTGVPVYFSNGQWRRYSDDAQVTA